MSTLMCISEKELEPEIKKKEEINFVWRIKWTFYSGGEKMRNANGHQGENEQQKKKCEQHPIQYFLPRACN